MPNLCNQSDARFDHSSKSSHSSPHRVWPAARSLRIQSHSKSSRNFFDPPTHFPSASGIAGLDFGIHMSPNCLVQTLRFFSGSLDSNTENSVWKSASGPCANQSCIWHSPGNFHVEHVAAENRRRAIFSREARENPGKTRENL